jgi:PST family polysaccharide transporter
MSSNRTTSFLTVVRNAFSMVAVTVVERAAGFAIFLAIARWMGPDSLGTYAMALSFLAVFTPIAHLGQRFILIREVARSPEDSERYLLHSSILTSGAAIVSVAAMILAAWALGYSHGTLTLLAAGAVTLWPESLVDVAESVVKAWERMEMVGILRSSIAISRVVVSIYLLISGFGLVALFLTMAAHYAALWLLYLVLVLKPKFPRVRPDVGFVRSLSAASVTFLAMSMLSALYKSGDVLVLYHVTTPADVGVYSAASRLVRLVNLLAPAIVLALVPGLSAAYGDRRMEDFGRLFRPSFKVFAMTGAFLAIVSTELARPIVSVTYSSGYEGAVIILRVLTWTFPLAFANALLFQTLVASDQERTSLRIVTVNLAVLVASLLLLTPALGSLGAAIGVLLAYATGFVQNLWHVHSHLSLDVLDIMPRVLLCASAAMLVWAYFPGPEEMAVLLSALAYAIGLFPMRLIGKEELQWVKTRIGG